MPEWKQSVESGWTWMEEEVRRDNTNESAPQNQLLPGTLGGGGTCAAGFRDQFIRL